MLLLPSLAVAAAALLASTPGVPPSIDSSLRATSESSTPKLQVLYANDRLAVVAKPPNVPCHRYERKHKRKRTIVRTNKEEDEVIPVLQRAIATFPEKERVHLVHRLDSPTSGCLVIAFSSEAARAASEALSTGQKTYYALCRGDGKAMRERGMFRVDGDVKDSRGKVKTGALTELECLWGTDGPPRRCCLVRAEPLTGYWHQIRQHLAREHHPIVGENKHHPDRKENKFWREELGLLPKSRVCLHCHCIALKRSEECCIPEVGLVVKCPLPKDMTALIDLTDWSNDARSALPDLFEGAVSVKGNRDMIH